MLYGSCCGAHTISQSKRVRQRLNSQRLPANRWLTESSWLHQHLLLLLALGAGAGELESLLLWQQPSARMHRYKVTTYPRCLSSPIGPPLPLLPVSILCLNHTSITSSSSSWARSRDLSSHRRHGVGWSTMLSWERREEASPTSTSTEHTLTR